MAVRFDVSCELDYEVFGQTEFLFYVQAAQTAHQSVDAETLAITGVHYFTRHVQPDTGNRLVRASAGPGTVQLAYSAAIDIAPLAAPPEQVHELPVALLPPEALQYLLPSRYCPSDRLLEFARREFGTVAPGFARVEGVCDWVNRHVSFAPGSSNVHTDALDVLANRRGVCRDFAHLSITLLRALNVPARFVTGYDYGIPASYGPTDFHAYVEAFLGDRWFIFDATRLCPRNGLVRIGTGRDAADVPFATLFGPAQFRGMRIDIRPRGSMEEGLIEDDRSLALSTAALGNAWPGGAAALPGSGPLH